MKYKLIMKKLIAYSKCLPILLKGFYDLWQEISIVYNKENLEQINKIKKES